MGEGMIKGTIGGLIGGAIGATVWAAITYFANAEVGWIAWGVGLVTGLGVRAMCGEQTGAGLGVMASVIAVVSILGGKYVAIELLIAKEMDSGVEELVTENDMIVSYSDEVVGEWEEEGKSVAWPPGMTFDEADEEADYPPEIWSEGKSRWDALGAEEQQAQITERQAVMKEFMESFMGSIRDEAFKDSFGPLDIVFFLLAIVTAFKVGSGMSAE